VADICACFIRFLTGVSTSYLDAAAFAGNAVYYANHSSHLDFLVIWASLPRRQRRKVVPVGALDYWGRTPFRRWLACRIFKAVLIERHQLNRESNPIPQMQKVLNSGNSLIVFPQGTRADEGERKTFKNGIYHLAKKRPETRFVPVYLHNLNRMLPKGEILPLPLAGSVIFGRSFLLEENESRPEFIAMAQQNLQDLCNHA